MVNDAFYEDMPAPNIAWVTVTPTPTPYKITDVAFVAGKFGKRDTILVLSDPNTLATYRMTVWGPNYNWLYNSFGPKKEAWLGQTVGIWKEGNNRVVGKMPGL